ncbi:uncharacterized protein ASCRUDRAFT_69495 [Ascoidea rubescens DSM 1968]|uniref:Uncharacterized protein n=1 Tax=Ascoidea rubescens DSM 1968 TaxID=1344418 RepID=A0A1D2VJF5_9ASCO|nr:hypothetical protein ASCRUDRAFT_69495 [Ascoidea rubescens DSM 1968]ODV61756.1 hypothetical protein ASCRUDRAFT_69495 [Ascoidea rubescens DSM 1968]
MSSDGISAIDQELSELSLGDINSYLFDVLDGTDEYPKPQKISKESFDTGLKDLITNSKISIKELDSNDNFDIDEFLYKNSRFYFLNDLSKDLDGLIKDLDNDLILLINDELYDDVIKLTTSINKNKNFEDLISNLKVSLIDYIKFLNKNLIDYQSTSNIINVNLYYKKKFFKVNKFIEKSILLFDLVDVFEKKMNNFSDNIEQIKELTSFYFSIHQLINSLSFIEDIKETDRPENKNCDEVLTLSSLKSFDVHNNITYLNNITLNDLLIADADSNDDTQKTETKNTLNNESFKFLKQLFKKVNVLRFEYIALLNEHLDKIKDIKTKSVELHDLMGIYEIIGKNKEFLKKLHE